MGNLALKKIQKTYMVFYTMNPNILKPIFHWNGMDTNNMKSTWPMPAPCVGAQRQLYISPARVGSTNFNVCVGITHILAFLDTNMLVSPTQNCGIGGLSQREDPT